MEITKDWQVGGMARASHSDHLREPPSTVPEPHRAAIVRVAAHRRGVDTNTGTMMGAPRWNTMALGTTIAAVRTISTPNQAANLTKGLED